MAFVQIIEIETTRPDEVEALVSQWRAKTEGTRKAQRGTFTKDRDRPDLYVQIVEFPSYEDAMANSQLSETAAFAEKLRALCDGPLLFRNLDVRSVEELWRHTRLKEERTMGRKVADCRDFPSESGCTLTISGEENEVVVAATQHAVSVHGHEDTDEVRAWLRQNLKDEVPA
jgi:hypothetical protein